MTRIEPKVLSYLKRKEPTIKKKLETEFETIHSDGAQKIRELPSSASILYTPLHKSHLDYILLLADTFRQDLPFPRVVSGSNLLNGFTGSIIRHVANLDFHALGTLSIPRTLPRNASEEEKNIYEKEIKAFQTEFASGLENGVLAIFPEAREVETGKVKTGRTYTGKERLFSPLFAREAVKHDNLYIIPTAITYDWVPETQLFAHLQEAKDRKKEWKYTGLEAKTFMWNLWHGGKGNVHINYGDPIKASEYKTSDLIHQTQQAAYELVHPTDIMIACHVARERYEQEGILTRGTIPVVGTQVEEQFAQKGLRSIRDFYDRLDAYKKTQRFLENQGVLKRKKAIHLAPHKSKIIDYYANQIAHFLK